MFADDAMLILGSGPPGVACAAMVILPVAQALICWFTQSALLAIPEKYRFQKPEHVWLLMVPFFNIVYNFWVFPRTAESFQAYFYSHGIADVEDCGERRAWGYCISMCFVFVPCIGQILPAIFIILFLIQANELKERIDIREARTRRA